MIRRPRRSVPATLVALVLLAVAVLGTIAAIQLLLGQPPIISVRTLTAPVVGRPWNDPVTITIGAVVAVIGLALLVTALLPGRPTVLPLADDPDGTGSRLTEAGVSRPSLHKDLTSTVATADGVSSSRVKVRRRRVTAAVRTPAAATDGIPEQVRSLLGDRLGEINPVRQPKVRVRASTERKR